MSNTKESPLDISTTSRAARRDHRIKLSVLTSVLSKGVTIGVQMAALPLALHALGKERFGVYVMITALLSWINLASAGLFPGLTREISRADCEDREHAAALFTAAFYLVAALSLMCGSIATGVLYFTPVDFLFGAGFELYADEIRLGGFVAIVLLVVQTIGGVAESARAGLQEQYINNNWGTVGNLLSFALLVVAAQQFPFVVVIVLAVNGSVAAAKLVNMMQLTMISHRHLLPRPSQWKPLIAKVLIGSGTAFLLVQFSVLAVQQASTYVVGYLGGPGEVAVFSVMQRMIVLLGGVVVMFTQPVWPAVSEAMVRRDYQWAQKRASRLVCFLILYAVVVAVVIAIAGKTIIHHWVGNEVTPTVTLLVLTGAYFVVVVWNHVHYTLLIGVGRTWYPAVTLAAEAVVVLLLCMLTVPAYGAEGGMIALLAAGLLVTAWLAPIGVMRSFRCAGQ